MRSKRNTSPPKWALIFFRWFCHPDFLEDIEGDLVEKYSNNLTKDSLMNAKFSFIFQVIKLIRPGIINSSMFSGLVPIPQVYKSMLSATMRRMKKEKSYVATNVLGLTLGIGILVITQMYCSFEKVMIVF